MPNRVIREGINDSKKINAIGFEAEIFYRRLFAVADDFGYFEADIELLRSDLYKRLVDKITDEDVLKWMNACKNIGLIDLYEVKGKPYGQIIKFDQSLRIMRSKYPNREGKYTTKEEYLQQLKVIESETPEVRITHKPIEPEIQNEITTKLNMVEQWLKDLPNDSDLEDMCRINGLKLDYMKSRIKDFKSKAETTYPTKAKFLKHFRNWVDKNPVQYIDKPKTRNTI